MSEFTEGIPTGGIKETLPGQGVSGPGMETPKAFQVYTDSSPYPANVSSALETFLKYDVEGWKSTTDGLHYQVIPSDYKSGKSDQTFYVSVYIYNQKPGKGVKPIHSYPKAYFVDEKLGEFQNQYLVSYMFKGQKVSDPSLDYTPPPHSIPNNFAEFKKLDPQLFQEFYEAFIYGMAMRMMKQLRDNQAKMKQAMRNELS